MNKQQSDVLERVKVALLPALHSGMTGVDVCDVLMSALDQHITDRVEATKVARLLRASAKSIVEQRN